jgi:hypothetical protein
MENYELFKQIEPSRGGFEKLRARLTVEDEIEREESSIVRWVVAALFIAVLSLSLARLDLPARPGQTVRDGLIAGNPNISPTRVTSESALVSRLTGVTQRVQIFWMSPKAEAQAEP